MCSPHSCVCFPDHSPVPGVLTTHLCLLSSTQSYSWCAHNTPIVLTTALFLVYSSHACVCCPDHSPVPGVLPHTCVCCLQQSCSWCAHHTSYFCCPHRSPVPGVLTTVLFLLCSPQFCVRLICILLLLCHLHLVLSTGLFHSNCIMEHLNLPSPPLPLIYSITFHQN